MEKKEYELLNEVQTDHWVWIARRKVIQTMIERVIKPTQPLSIADVGAGYGANLELLIQHGPVSALETYEDALATIKKNWGVRVQTIPWKCPDKLGTKFDLMVLADVLEHIPNDRQMADWIFDHLKPNGYVLITVPAHKWLWTQMDDFLHHIRRYNKKNLGGLFSERFRIIKLSYYHFFLFPAKLLFVIFDRIERKLFPNRSKQSYNHIPPLGINRLFSWIAQTEAKTLQWISYPTGPSLVLLAQKK